MSHPSKEPSPLLLGADWKWEFSAYDHSWTAVHISTGVRVYKWGFYSDQFGRCVQMFWPSVDAARKAVADANDPASCADGAHVDNQRRAPVQADIGPRPKHPAGTISWDEHVEAWNAYAAKYGTHQSAERMAERGGFGWGELVMFLGHEPTTWKERS